MHYSICSNVYCNYLLMEEITAVTSIHCEQLFSVCSDAVRLYQHVGFGVGIGAPQIHKHSISSQASYEPMWKLRDYIIF